MSFPQRSKEKKDSAAWVVLRKHFAVSHTREEIATFLSEEALESCCLCRGLDGKAAEKAEQEYPPLPPPSPMCGLVSRIVSEFFDPSQGRKA